MNEVTFPLKVEMSGPAVAHLQDALQVLLDRAALLSNDAQARAEMTERLKPERANQFYRETTRRLVGRFQEGRHLEASGAVDESTANAINALLRELGVLEPGTAPRSFIVSGRVLREDGLPLADLCVCAFHDTGGNAIRLGEDRT